MSASAAVPGKTTSDRRAVPRSGVRPPCWKMYWATTKVRPLMAMLIAMPATSWLPFWVIDTKACTMARATETAMPAAIPSHGFCVV